MSRRKLFGAAGVTAAVVGRQARVPWPAGRRRPAPTFGGLDQPVPFRGERQAGIITPQQDRMHFAAFDVTTDNRDDVIALLKQWTEMAERMTQGDDAVPNGAIGGNPYAPPDDTGEALGLPASALTLTDRVRSVVLREGRQGQVRHRRLSARPALADLPKFTNEILDPARCGGDICVQACAHDPQVAVHAVRNLARVGFGTVAVRYSQLGFGRTSSTTREQSTPRNMLGFKDGTNNIKAEDTEALDKNVWVAGGDGPDWLTGGTYLVTRRDSKSHRGVGPHNTARAGAGDRQAEGQRRTQRLRRRVRAGGLRHQGRQGHTAGRCRRPHPAGVHPIICSGIKMLRRGYNFTDGSDGFGHLDAGLFFIAFVRSPATNFIPVLAQMSGDALNEYIFHTGTAVFACPPGLREGVTRRPTGVRQLFG